MAVSARRATESIKARHPVAVACCVCNDNSRPSNPSARLGKHQHHAHSCPGVLTTCAAEQVPPLTLSVVATRWSVTRAAPAPVSPSLRGTRAAAVDDRLPARLDSPNSGALCTRLANSLSRMRR